MNNLGISFSPLDSGDSGNSKTGPTNPVQEAIKILSFRMPTVVGAGAPSPGALMGGPSGNGTQIGNDIAEQWIRRFLMGQGGQAGTSSAGQPGAPQQPSGPSGVSPLPNPNVTFGAPAAPRVPLPPTTNPSSPPPQTGAGNPFEDLWRRGRGTGPQQGY